MAAWLIALGATSLGVLLVLLVVLLGHLRRLARSLQRLQSELTPILEEVRDGSQRAQGRLADLERRRESLQRRPGRIEG
jgi:hypothetical protein